MLLTYLSYYSLQDLPHDDVLPILPIHWQHELSCHLPQSSLDHESLFASLRKNPYWTLAEKPGMDLMIMNDESIREIAQVFVILFGVGHTNQQEQEGIYSLRYQGPEGLPQETIIVFESQADAERYASMLEVMMTHTPHVCSIGAEDLVDFCVERGYRCRMEQSGTVLVPPDFSVKVTDWERSKKLRSGSFAVLESDPQVEPNRPMSSSSSSNGGSSYSTSLSWLSSEGGEGSTLDSHDSLSHDQLSAIRSRLEALLPPETPELN